MSTWGIVVAAGSGVRFGRPKQFLRLGNGRLVDLAVEITRKCCDEVVLVLPADVTWDGPAVVTVTGGATRSASVGAGLRAVHEHAEIIVVHDAARPLARSHLFDAVISAVRRGADAAVPALPVSDTVKRVAGDEVVETVLRDGLVTVQTPQAFRAALLRAAHVEAGDASDDAALIEAAGGRVVIVPGDPHNLKITTPADVAIAAALTGVAPPGGSEDEL